MSERLDQLFHTYNHDRELLHQHVQHGLKSVRLAKAAAWRMARRYLDMQAADHNRFLDLVRSTHGNGPDAIDQWVEDSFAPVTLIGEDHWALIKAVGEGMTQKQYLAKTPQLFLHERKAQQKREATPPVPPAPADDMPLPDQVKHWRLRAESLERRVKEMESVKRHDQRRIALLEQAVNRLNRILRQVEAT